LNRTTQASLKVHGTTVKRYSAAAILSNKGG